VLLLFNQPFLVPFKLCFPWQLLQSPSTSQENPTYPPDEYVGHLTTKYFQRRGQNAPRGARDLKKNMKRCEPIIKGDAHAWTMSNATRRLGISTRDWASHESKNVCITVMDDDGQPPLHGFGFSISRPCPCLRQVFICAKTAHT
jgi:hypothetical protein